MMTAVALLDYHFHACSAAYVLAVQEFAVAFSDYQFDAWFAAYAVAVQDSAVWLLHYPLLAWLAVYTVAGRGGGGGSCLVSRASPSYPKGRRDWRVRLVPAVF